MAYNFIKQRDNEALSYPSKSQYGLIAQEVEKILPELITQHHSTTIINNDEVNLKGVNYNGLIAILIKGHQEQAEQIKSYEEVIIQLSDRLSQLENTLEKENE